MYLSHQTVAVNRPNGSQSMVNALQYLVQVNCNTALISLAKSWRGICNMQ